MRNDFVKHYQRYIDAWGEESQIRMCLEEMSELSKELLKKIRLDKDDFGESVQEKKDINLKCIKEEIADVLNMAEQLEYMFGENEIENIREQKIQRTNKLPNEGEN